MFYSKKMTMVATVCFIMTVSGTVLATPAASSESVKVGQQTEIQATQQELAKEEMMSLLWMRSAAEYRALCYQGYNTAMAQVDTALADPARKGKPLAIVLDCDETVVDNIGGMSESAAAGNGLYTSAWWRDWIHEARSGAMPGAAKFLNEVHRKGVSIFYVSNRFAHINYAATVKNLKGLNFPSVDREHVLLMTNTTDKQPRFDSVAAKYDVIVYMGDNAGDLPLYTDGTSMVQRNKIIDEHQADFGIKYIVFPNPAYGSWVGAMAKGYFSLTPQEREQVNRSILLKKVTMN
ncbi:5'-nucleotidase, lipoprotein e(P4) family [Megasphaera sueciensis]|jgi:5'-nucleotidase (lipoprotein e(P4) family)|uniref:5'-nucleotidase, lipoprotein e(P4) family n=1 Tax=Megasphaera sueciensis TaxID=349094 RepID=UPI003D053108